MDNANDMFAGVVAAPSEFLRGLASRAIELNEQIDSYEAMAAELKKERDFILTDRMVAAMIEAGFDEMKLPDGWKFKINQHVIGTLPKPKDNSDEEGAAKRADALSWLEHNGADGLLKTDVIVAFQKSDHNRAVDTQQMLVEQGLPAVITSGINHQSMLAWVREALKNGDNVDMEVLGLSTIQKVKITPPKGEL
jgi:hypothetical protein